MISSFELKQAQLQNGYFSHGDGAEKLLIIGSCRSIPYVDYLMRANDGRFTIIYLDPFNWHWNERDEFIDFEAKINSLETDQRILAMLAATTIYLHEYYDSFGMFNSSKASPKNIYQFGLNPQLDICIPNFNNVNVLGHPKAEGEAALEKFYGICRQTDFPEMEKYFREHWRNVRIFWTSNHISKRFTLFIFWHLNEKFLHLSLTDLFWAEISKEDLFANAPTPVTQADRDNYGITW